MERLIGGDAFRNTSWDGNRGVYVLMILMIERSRFGYCFDRSSQSSFESNFSYSSSDNHGSSQTDMMCLPLKPTIHRLRRSSSRKRCNFSLAGYVEIIATRRLLVSAGGDLLSCLGKE